MKHLQIAARQKQLNYGNGSPKMAGMVTGIAEHILMMEHLWVRRKTPSAKSIRSHRAGPFCPAAVS